MPSPRVKDGLNVRNMKTPHRLPHKNVISKKGFLFSDVSLPRNQSSFCHLQKQWAFWKIICLVLLYFCQKFKCRRWCLLGVTACAQCRLGATSNDSCLRKCNENGPNVKKEGFRSPILTWRFCKAFSHTAVLRLRLGWDQYENASCGVGGHSAQSSWSHLDSDALLQASDLSQVDEWVTGVAKSPYDPEHNSTAIMTADGNLYSATVTDFKGRDPAICRIMGPSAHLRTVQYNNKWLHGKWWLFLCLSLPYKHCQKAGFFPWLFLPVFRLSFPLVMCRAAWGPKAAKPSRTARQKGPCFDNLGSNWNIWPPEFSRKILPREDWEEMRNRC